MANKPLARGTDDNAEARDPFPFFAQLKRAMRKITTDIDAHVAAADPHTGYAKESDTAFNAPSTPDYLVGTAQAGLSAEIVVGATPGGELGGTWASPTVDATHSGSSHAATQAAAEATAAAALTAHSAGTAVRTSAVAIANTETVVLSSSIASGLVAGSTFAVKAYGRLTSGATGGSSIFRFRIGTTTLTGNIAATLTLANSALVTNAPFKVEMLVTIRSDGAAGTVIGQVSVNGGAVGAFTVVADVSAGSATVAVDTTVTNLVEFTYISGNAGTTSTFENVSIERVKV